MDRAPRKKEKRPMKRGAALLLVLGLAVAAGVAAVLLCPKTAELPPLPAQAEAVHLLSRSAEEIREIAALPREGGGFRLIREGESLIPEGMENIALDEELIGEIELMAADMVAEQTVLENKETAELADFGLAHPALRLTVRYADGEEKTVCFGDLSPEETPQRYAMPEGENAVYTVLEAECQSFFREKDYFRAFDQPRLDGSLLDRVRVAGDTVLDARYTPSGWILDAPYRYPADTARMTSLLTRIEGMAFDMCLGDAQDVDLTAYGLDAPALTVTLTQAATVITGETAEGEQVSLDVPEKEYTLLVGDETGKSGVYVMWKGQVFRASNFLLGFWKELDADALLLRQPVNFPANDLVRVSFAAGDVQTAYQVTLVESVTENNQVAVDEYGRTLYECKVIRDPGGEEVDQEAFIAWYLLLQGLQGDGRLPEGFEPQGAPDAVIEIASNSITREIALYPYDSLHEAICVDGTALFYTAASFLKEASQTP